MTDERFEEIWKVVEPINGWYQRLEARILAEEAERAPGPIIEIGCAAGKSTILLALASNQVVHTIDPFQWEGFPISHAIDNLIKAVDPQEIIVHRLSGFDEIIRDSRPRDIGTEKCKDLLIYPEWAAEVVNMIPNGIGLLHIDDSHEYENVLQQLELYASKVHLGGVIAMHDWLSNQWSEVQNAGLDWLAKNQEWQIVRTDAQIHGIEGIAILKRRG